MGYVLSTVTKMRVGVAWCVGRRAHLRAPSGLQPACDGAKCSMEGLQQCLSVCPCRAFASLCYDLVLIRDQTSPKLSSTSCCSAQHTRLLEGWTGKQGIIAL